MGGATVVNVYGGTVNLYADGLPQASPEVRDHFEEGRRLQDGHDHDKAIGEFETALATADTDSRRGALHLHIGTSQYLLGRSVQADGSYAEALRLFQAAADDEGQAAALGNLGVVYADRGELERAEEHYEQALEINPDAEDAAYNRDLIRDLMQQLEDSQNDQQSGQDSNSEEGGGAQQTEGDSQSEQQGQEGSAGDPGTESQDGESAARSQDEMNQEDLEAMQRELERAAQEAEQQEAREQDQQSMSEAEAEAMRRAQEQRQAMEQWLRRIPNDPGGLLRRKFLYQYQRQGRDQDGNNLWPDDEVQPW